MSKKHFIALADTIRANPKAFQDLANFCASQSSNFDRTRWLEYVAKTK